MRMRRQKPLPGTSSSSSSSQSKAFQQSLVLTATAADAIVSAPRSASPRNSSADCTHGGIELGKATRVVRIVSEPSADGTNERVDPTRAAVWVDAETWHEAYAALTAQGWDVEKCAVWMLGQRASLDALTTRLENDEQAVIKYASDFGIAGCDSVGLWKYEPYNGVLCPFHLHQLMPVVRDPSQLDRVGCGVLASRLVLDGHGPYHARWGAQEGVNELGMEWCGGPRGKALTPEIMRRGGSAVAHDVGEIIEARKRGALPKKWLAPEWIARFKEYLPGPDGPGRFGEFWWHGLPYFLMPKCFELMSALWRAPKKSLSLEDAVLRVWGASASRCRQYENRLHACKSRINECSRPPASGFVRERLGTPTTSTTAHAFGSNFQAMR